MKLSSFLTLLLAGAARVSGQGVPANSSDVDVVVYPNCAVEDYYSSLSGTDPTEWTREELQTLLEETHQNQLPLFGATSGDDDVYYALIDMDRGDEVGTVHLVYRDINMGAFPFADPNYWDAERLWPEDRGTASPSLAFTDVHHLKPADRTVLLRKGDLFFGMCDTVEFEDRCVSPATDETAESTAQDGKIWQAPEATRGEIARALMYMDLRYIDLELRDCGPFENAMAYLSQMLEWHAAYPPDAAEIRRNNQACSRWQGNRNPFIDYPELAEALYGPPQEILQGTRTYPSCVDIPTAAPTATPNECGQINAGNVPFFLVNSDNPDEVLFLSLFDIPGDVELFITDQAWNGTHLLKNVEGEGTVSMVTPEGGIEQGDTFGYGDGANLGERWEPEDGRFSLGDEGDNIFLYCIDADLKIRFLAGFSNSGSWAVPGMTAEEYGSTSSALPEELLNAHILLAHQDNYFYNGTRDETIPILRQDIRDPEQWVGDNDARWSEEGAEVPSGVETYRFAVSLATTIFVSTLLALIS